VRDGVRLPHITAQAEIDVTSPHKSYSSTLSKPLQIMLWRSTEENCYYTFIQSGVGVVQPKIKESSVINKRFNYQKLNAPHQDRTGDLQIMRLTRCQLR
jgi:hypothetical protein